MKGQKETPRVHPPPRILLSGIHLGWTRHAPPGGTQWLAKDNPETNPINIKSETMSHIAEQFSWVPLPCCSLPGCPLPIKSLALWTHVSLDNSFPSVRQEPTLWALEGALLPTTSGPTQFKPMLWKDQLYLYMKVCALYLTFPLWDDQNHVVIKIKH